MRIGTLLLSISFYFISAVSFSQNSLYSTSEVLIDSSMYGSLYFPENVETADLVILIGGSGPTDRDGNQEGMINNSLKGLAQGLAEKGIAAFSYDKRFLTEIKKGYEMDESALRFSDFSKDAKLVLEYFRKDERMKNIIFAGHSEGSLVGMLAAQNGADAFVSIAGGGRTSDEILVEQIAKNAPMLKEETQRVLALLKKGETVEDFHPMLASLFRPSVQNYMISWLAIDPKVEIQRLKMPVMIINGTKDIQVEEKEAGYLREARPDAKLLIIENMNHVLKIIDGDLNENMKSYMDPELPVALELVEGIAEFVRKL
jgi:uncharacterized protein